MTQQAPKNFVADWTTLPGLAIFASDVFSVAPSRAPSLAWHEGESPETSTERIGPEFRSSSNLNFGSDHCEKYSWQNLYDMVAARLGQAIYQSGTLDSAGANSEYGTEVPVRLASD